MNILNKGVLQFFLLIACSWILSCKGVKQREDSSLEENSSEKMKGAGIGAAVEASQERRATSYSSISPGSCRIKGKIIEVLPIEATDKDSPCGQAPCKAIVQIEQLIGCGSGVTKRPKTTEQVTMFFSLTLNKNSNSTPALPGLEVGSLFEANVQAPMTGGVYTVGVYEKK